MLLRFVSGCPAPGVISSWLSQDRTTAPCKVRLRSRLGSCSRLLTQPVDRYHIGPVPGFPTIHDTSSPPAVIPGPVLQPTHLIPLHLRQPCTAAFASAPIDSWPDCNSRSSPNEPLTPTSSPLFDTASTPVTFGRDNVYGIKYRYGWYISISLYAFSSTGCNEKVINYMDRR